MQQIEQEASGRAAAVDAARAQEAEVRSLQDALAQREQQLSAAQRELEQGRSQLQAREQLITKREAELGGATGRDERLTFIEGKVIREII